MHVCIYVYLCIYMYICVQQYALGHFSFQIMTVARMPMHVLMNNASKGVEISGQKVEHAPLHFESQPLTPTIIIFTSFSFCITIFSTSLLLFVFHEGLVRLCRDCPVPHREPHSGSEPDCFGARIWDWCIGDDMQAIRSIPSGVD